MSEDERRSAESEDADDRREDDGAERPAQHAAQHDPGGEDEEHPQDETDSTTWDSEEHSEAPGPFGTG